jgi:hypothetical protein
VVTEQYRYISYENGAEELYDRTVDPNEWDNIAEQQDMKKVKTSLKKHLPEQNALWSDKSTMKHNEYFIKHMAENSESK